MTITSENTITAPQLTINGESRASDDTLSVIDPSTGQPFIEVPSASLAQLDEAVESATRAFAEWSSTPITQRQAKIQEIGQVVRDNLDELAQLVMREQGKPLNNARGEIMASLRQVEVFGSIELEPEVLRDDETGKVVLSFDPIGVVGAITVWNYPFLAAMFKLVPGLVAGNTVIIKPSPYTPVSTLRLGELLQGVLPAGVLQVLAGGDELGRALVAHEGIHKISFTGSVPTGKAIMASAAATLKRVTLELGGNDAGVVLPDADPETLGPDLFWAAFSNSGQVCAALKRLYVPEDKVDAYAAAIAREAAKVVVGPGDQEGVTAGPVQNAAQLEQVKRLAQAARDGGGEIVFEGQVPDGPGYWFPTTIVKGLSEGNALVDEEPFGPILPILTYRDLDDAIERANSTVYGLGASVWTADPNSQEAIDVAERLEAGSVWINQHPVVTATIPFGGVKQSGVGVEGSILGLKAYTNPRVLNIKR
ncbi:MULTISPECIES: aldehyde dehydrogenase family protein [Mycobacteriales]|uniref:NAD+-dependent aldehyde dehydrogenase n=1 Tax=Gordonia rubripertincta TaxID=36822 RepID=A0A1Y0DAB4_GORRU|nr:MULTISPECIES: aldehyde dehydrogenase family protein [Mycobacteriales]ART84095.1 NAD+-dependent aldehyde dehydrogenase [Gordonia rubripertincta]ASR05573.1 Succinate-semialdehyde dehydrogenase [NADP(+)] [Gordonia rubripertincta]